MAEKILRVDDLDGETTEGVEQYRYINPETGGVWLIDLCPENYDKLVAALKPFIGHGTPQAKPTATRSAVAAGAAVTKSYNTAALKEWAEPLGKWTGKRPSKALIAEFEAATS